MLIRSQVKWTLELRTGPGLGFQVFEQAGFTVNQTSMALWLTVGCQLTLFGLNFSYYLSLFVNYYLNSILPVLAKRLTISIV